MGTVGSRKRESSVALGLAGGPVGEPVPRRLGWCCEVRWGL